MNNSIEYPLQELGLFLTEREFLEWGFDQDPLNFDSNFDIKIRILLDEAFKVLLDFKSIRYSDYSEHEALAKVNGQRLNRILQDVQKSQTLNSEYSIINTRFLEFEERVFNYLNLNLFFSSRFQNEEPNLTSGNEIILDKKESKILIKPKIELEQQKIVVRAELSFLIDVVYGPIMTSDEYERLLGYVDEMLEKQAVPDIVIPFESTVKGKVPVENVRFAFSSISREIFGKKHQKWIRDSVRNFFQFNESEITTYKHWRKEGSTLKRF